MNQALYLLKLARLSMQGALVLHELPAGTQLPLLGVECCYSVSIITKTCFPLDGRGFVLLYCIQKYSFIYINTATTKYYSLNTPSVNSKTSGRVDLKYSRHTYTLA